MKTTCSNCDKKLPQGRTKFCSKKCISTYHNSRKNYDYSRNANLKHEYGITLEDYNTLHKGQDGKCAICGLAETYFDHRWGRVVALAVDHEHRTGRVRGLLCRRCNQLLGKAEDNPEILLKAASYLQRQ